MLKSMVTISLAQVPVIKGNLVENLANHLEMIELSSNLRANVVVFPELSLTGYELELAQQLAFSQSRDSFVELSCAAIEHNIIIVVGCPLVAKKNAKPTIGSVICFPDGNVEFYSKQYLHDSEGEYCSSGSVDYLFNINGYRIGLAVCADFSSPQHSSHAANGGADIYIVSALISESGYQCDAEILANIATMYRFPVLLSNHISQTGGWQACGNNTVWDANGQIVFNSDSKDPCLVLTTLLGNEVSAVKVSI